MFRNPTFKTVLFLLGIVFIATNLRASIVSVGPVMPEIIKALKLSPIAAGLVTSIPLLCFAFGSALMPRFAEKRGLEKVLFYSIIILVIGMILRSYGGIIPLFIGAALVGIGITIANVLMPAFIKKHFPNKVGLITAVYLTAMNLASALAVGYSIKMGYIGQMGWRSSIGIWVILSIVALFFWIPILLVSRPKNKKHKIKQKPIQVWKNPLAWQISIFMGTQSAVFYVMAAWFPTILQSWGMAAEQSGWMLSYFQFGSVPMMLFGPMLADKTKSQTGIVWFTFITLLAGVVLILIYQVEFALLASVLIGIAVGMGFALSTMFFVLRSEKVEDAAQLSGMAQSVGYLLAGIFPPLFGMLYEITESWMWPIASLLGVAVLLLFTGIPAAKDKIITQEGIDQ